MYTFTKFKLLDLYQGAVMNSTFRRFFSLALAIALNISGLLYAESVRRGKKADTQPMQQAQISVPQSAPAQIAQPKKLSGLTSTKTPIVPASNDGDADQSPTFLAALVFNINSPAILTPLIGDPTILSNIIQYYSKQNPALSKTDIINIFNYIPLDTSLTIVKAVEANNYNALPSINTLQQEAQPQIPIKPKACQLQKDSLLAQPAMTNNLAIELLADYAIKYVAIAAANQGTADPRALNVTPEEFETDAIAYFNDMQCSERIITTLKPLLRSIIESAKNLEDIRQAAIKAGKISLSSAKPAFPTPDAIRSHLIDKKILNNTPELVLNIYAQAYAQIQGQTNQDPNDTANNPFFLAAKSKAQQTGTYKRLAAKANGYLIARVLESIGQSLYMYLFLKNKASTNTGFTIK